MRIIRHLYVQVLLAIVLGISLGHFFPEVGASLKPLGDAFIKLIKMLVGPIIFATIVSGIGGIGDLRKVGRVGLKALIYFEILTTVALLIGLIVGNVFTPGTGVHADPATLDARGVAHYAKAAGEKTSLVDWALHIIPSTFVGAFVAGDILQVLCVSLLFGVAVSKLGEIGRPVVSALHEISRAFFMMVNVVSQAAPAAAFGAMAFTVGKYGLGSLVSLVELMACVYLTCAVFIVVVLGLAARLSGFSLWKLLQFIREELIIVIGTSSSEAALPALMKKMERAGCAPAVVGIVLPTGYSFNLDGTCIYLTMAALYISQAIDAPLSLGQQVGLLLVLLLTSKGAAAVTGGGFITLAATLTSTGTLPVAGMALVLGVDRFMSEARAITNFLGNAVATLVIAKWEGGFDLNAKESGAVLRPAAPAVANQP